MIRSTLLAATMFAVPVLAHAHARSPSPYKTLDPPIYTCVPGDNAVALNGLLAAGGEVDVAAGKCHVATSVTLSVPGTSLIGAGSGQTVFTPLNGADIDLITIGLSSSTYAGGGFTLSGITANGLITTTADPNAVGGHGVHVTAGVHPVTGYSWGANLTDVETENEIGGFWITGSSVTATNVNTHNNRHSGFFVQGSTRQSSPYDIADNDGIKGSKAQNNNLDNVVGKTYDNINWSDHSANGFVGGPNVGDGNTITAGDVLFGCPPTETKCQGTQTGPFLAQGNTLTNTQPVQDMGIRAYGNVDSVTIDSNTISTSGTGVALLGDVTNSIVSNNTLSGQHAFGVELDTLSGGSVGDKNTVNLNDVTMGDTNKPVVSVIAQTNATITNNNGHGGTYATSQAGAGLVFTGNQ